MSPLVKKIIDVGKTSKGVIIPHAWLDFLEDKHGSIDAVSMEVSDKLVIRPILKEALKNHPKTSQTIT